jgi:hypothetical protein
MSKIISFRMGKDQNTRMWRKWDNDEIELLQKEFPLAPDKAIAEKLGRTPRSIDWKARELGLHKSKEYLESNKLTNRWSSDEVEVIRKFYTNLTKKALLELLPKRTWSAIKTKASFMRVDRQPQSIKNEVAVNMSENERGYLAGAVDCDGFISMQGKRRGQNFQVWVGVANTDYNLVKKCLEITKIGRIHKATKHHPWKPAYFWTVYTFTGSYSVLKQIEPYLVRKKKQAQLALEFLELRKTMIRRNGRLIVTKDVLEIYEEMRKMNGGKGRKVVG